MKRRSAGFTLTETLAAVLIMTLMSGAMAVGVQFATREYKESMMLSESRILCASVTEWIRTELSNTNRIKLEGENVTCYLSFAHSVADKDEGGDVVQSLSAFAVKNGKLYINTVSASGGEVLDQDPALSDATYSSYDLKLSDLGITYTDTDGVFHVSFSVTDTQEHPIISDYSFDVFPLNSVDVN